MRPRHGLSRLRPGLEGNFTTFDDGWWDDDENYGTTTIGKYDSADDDAPHVAFIKSTPNPKSRANLDDVKGVGRVHDAALAASESPHSTGPLSVAISSRTAATPSPGLPRDGIPRRLGGIVVGVGALMSRRQLVRARTRARTLSCRAAVRRPGPRCAGRQGERTITPDVAYTGKDGPCLPTQRGRRPPVTDLISMSVVRAACPRPRLGASLDATRPDGVGLVTFSARLRHAMPCSD